ncbi:MAG: type II secretion system protein [bacterium]|nr:type II secretion system protein [bacterium]
MKIKDSPSTYFLLRKLLKKYVLIPSRASRRREGFTLIELLVVISIIGMLSSVVLASTNNARIKAKNLAKNTTINNYRTAFELLRNQIGDFPPPTNSTDACIGTHPDGLCGYVSSDTQDDTVNNLLNPYLPGVPGLEPMTYTSGQSFVFRGPIYACEHGVGACFLPIRVYLVWQLDELNQNCSPGFIWASWGGITRCRLDL